MLATAGLREGDDYETVLLDGFDPVAHIAIDGIVGFPGYKSNEPGQLERAGIPFDLFDPAEYDVPGSFGVIYTTRAFIDEHPTAAQDFVRATMRGLADAVADPAAASAAALELINGNGNPNFLSPEGETFRWATDSELIVSTTPAGTGLGVPDPAGLAGRARRVRRRRAVRRRRRAPRHRPPRPVADGRRLRRQRAGHLAAVTRLRQKIGDTRR